MAKYSKNKYVQAVCYPLLFGTWWTLSHLPLWVIYRFSDILQFFLYYVIRYRRKIVRHNLRTAFPDMKRRQLWLTERRFYRHFCDIFFESFKFFSISESEIRRRMKFEGIELLNESLRNGRSTAIFLGHYANWEWVSTLSLWIDKDVAVTAQIYHPLQNPIFDRLINFTRTRFGGYNIAMEHTLRGLMQVRKETGKSVVLGFIADQSPMYQNIHYWSQFLNHYTPYFTGCERLSSKLDMDVFYLDVRRVKRGYYIAKVKLLSKDAKHEPEFKLTELYSRALENTLKRNPPYWLWTHNRWKRTYEVWVEEMRLKDQMDRVRKIEAIQADPSLLGID